MANSKSSVSITTPTGATDICAKFTIDTVTTPFILTGVCKIAGEYVFSSWIKSDVSASVQIDTSVIEIGTTWTKVSVDITRAATDNQDLAIYFKTATSFYFYNTQLELGNKATKWQPSPYDVAQTIKETADKIEDVKASINPAIQKATELITGNRGGYVVFHRSVDSDGNQAEYPDEILIMDTPQTSSAKNVWRWNKSGLGHSSTGIKGPYTLAILADGSINADFITTGKMSANNIEGGSIKSSTFMSSFKDGNESFYRQLEIDRAALGMFSNSSKLDEVLYTDKSVPRVRLGNSSGNNGYLELYDGNSKMVSETNSNGNTSYYGQCGSNGNNSILSPSALSFSHNKGPICGISQSVDGSGIGLYGPGNNHLYGVLVQKNNVSGRDDTCIYDTSSIQFSMDGNYCGELSAFGSQGEPYLSLLVDQGDSLEIGHITKGTLDSHGRRYGVVDYKYNITIDQRGVMHFWDTMKYGDSTINGTWTTTINGVSFQYIGWRS